jgi:predicted TIM-barrel fold metal-dependent hydrolase
MTKLGVPLSQLETMADRLRGSDWHIQVFAEFSKSADLADRLRNLGVPIVIDHFGMIDSARGTGDPGFQAMLALLRDGVGWLKLSGPYLSSHQPMPHADMEPFAVALVEAAFDRLVWGTDWPHPSCGDKPPDNGAIRTLLDRWIPDVSIRRRILVDNPAALHGFPQP